MLYWSTISLLNFISVHAIVGGTSTCCWPHCLQKGLWGRTPTHCEQTPSSPSEDCLIVEHYLVVLCLSHGISAWGSTRDLCWQCTWWGWSCFCQAAAWGQVDTCSSKTCSIVWSLQRQMSFWYPPISGLKYDNSAYASDPRAFLTVLGCHLRPRACLCSNHKPLINRQVFTRSPELSAYTSTFSVCWVRNNM